jgi:hypothetical protein
MRNSGTQRRAAVKMHGAAARTPKRQRWADAENAQLW